MSVSCSTSSAAVTAAAIAELEIELTIKEGECQRLRSRIKALKNEATSTTTSLPTTSKAVAVPTLSLKNICREFPDFLFLLLPFIADRVIWNSIASSNKDMDKKSKTVLPPWPVYYNLPSFKCVAWSPCGTRIACSVYRNDALIIFDQRHGPLRNHLNVHGEHGISDLKYSPDGRFLVSTGKDYFVRLWDNTRNYEQLQEWNMAEEVVEQIGYDSYVSVSACSKYIVVSIGTCAVLKNVETGKTIKSLILPGFLKRIENIIFCSDDRAVFISRTDSFQVWHPYLDDDDENRLIILPRPEGYHSKETHSFSNDNTMVAIHNSVTKRGTVWSIDMDHKRLTEKIHLQCNGFYFTPDDKYIVYNTRTGLEVRSIVANPSFTDTTTNFWVNGNITNHDLWAKSFSPKKQQLIVERLSTHEYFIASYCIIGNNSNNSYNHLQI